MRKQSRLERKIRRELMATMNAVTPVDKPAERQQSAVRFILEEQKLRTRQDLYKMRVAVDSAENIYNPDRELLHDIYREVILDPNLASQWESRKMKTKEKPFKVVSESSGEEDKELTQVLESQWFFDLIDAWLESKAWGFSLIEFGDMTPDGEFLPYRVKGVNGQKKNYPDVNIIDRDNVKPETGIITSTPGMTTGLDMADPKFADHLMFVGSYRDHGWLRKAAKYILMKDNCVANWSEWAEVFGMDKRIGYTSLQGNDRDKFIRALRDLGSNGYGVFNSTDEVDYLGTNRSDAYLVYERFIDKVDENVSKLIFGQDVVSNQTGRIVGTVGENVSNMYGANDCRFIAGLVNKRLFPMMTNLGFTRWNGMKFMFDQMEKLSLVDRATIDEQTVNMTGKKLDQEYVEETYGVKQSDEEVQPPEPQNPNALQK